MTFPNMPSEGEGLKNFFRILLLLFLTVPLCAADVTVTTCEWISLDNKEIILGDIAAVFGTDQVLAAKLNSFYVDETPPSGKSFRITHADLKRRLENAGFPVEAIQFLGAYETVISRASGNDMTDNPIAKVILQFLHTHFALTGEEFDIHFRNIPEVNNPVSSTSFEVISTPGQNYHGSIVIVVAEKIGDKIVKKHPASVNVQTFQPVLTASVSVELNKPLKPEYFNRSKQETTFLSETPVREFSEIAGMQAARNIVKNSILTKEKMSPVPAVRQGDIVTITFDSDGFKITAQGRARKSGGVGEVIPVINLLSLKQVEAKVVDSTTVAVNF